MKILVLGGTGWVGHSIARDLHEHGYDVTIMTRGHKETYLSGIEGITRLTGDKNSEADMAEVLRSRYTHILDSVPSFDAVDHIVKYARGLIQYIHCSSTGGYAPLASIPGNETSPYLGFNGGTGWSDKRRVDDKVISLFNSIGFPATVIRPCYITGPGRFPLDNFGGRRERFIQDILEEKPLVLPENGLSLLQPIHVKELARSFRLALEVPRVSIGQIYNICLEHAFTLNRYLELTAGAFGKKPVIRYMDIEDILAKYGSEISELGLRFLASHMCFDISKARRDLGYVPVVTPEEAVEENAWWAARELGLK